MLSKETDELYDNYIRLVNSAANYADNYKYLPLRKAINKYCLDHPDIVAALVFEDRSDREDIIGYRGRTWKLHMRKELIFILSKDDCRTVALEFNPRWLSFMERFIIPEASRLSADMSAVIAWYQSAHGLPERSRS